MENNLENIVHEAKTLTFKRRKKEILTAKHHYNNNLITDETVKNVLSIFVGVTNGLNFDWKLTDEQVNKIVSILYNEIFHYDKTL